VQTVEDQSPLDTALVILLVAGALLGVAIRFQLNYNGLHIDEANYLFVGKQLLDGLEWPTKHYVFSSDIPILWLAIWDRLLPGFDGRGGAVVAGLVALVLWFGLICKLFPQREVRLVAGLLLLSQPTITSISRLATYDIVSFAAFGGALWMCLIAVQTGTRYWAVLTGSLLAVTVLMKYVTVLFLPFVFLGWFLHTRQIPWAALITTVIIGGFYGIGSHVELSRLYSEQIVIAHSANSEVLELINLAILPLWPLVFAILWFVIAKPELVKKQPFGSLIALASVLIAYHMLNLDRVAMYKHLAYSSAFLSILLVWCWQQCRHLGSGTNFFLLLMLCCQLGNSFLWNEAFEGAWPDSRAVIESISVDGQTEILSENAYLFRNALHGQVPIERLHDTTYADLDNDGQFDNDELMKAVHEGRFSHVYLDGLTNPIISQDLIFGPLKARYVLVSFESPEPLSGLDHSGSGLYAALFQRVDL